MDVAAAPALTAGAQPAAAAAVCLIVNPRSHRAAHGLADAAKALARAHGAEVATVGDAASIAAAMRSMLARRQRQVAVLAGDGTVQAIVDHLAAWPADAQPPDLLLLPGGRSNLTALDVASSGDALARLKTALLLAENGGWDAGIVERDTLCIAQPGAPKRHGFFVAAALLDAVIRRVHADRATAGGWLRSDAATPWWLLRLSVQALRGRSGIACPMLDVDAGALGRIAGPMRLLLLTTLAHRSGLIAPYADRGAGAVRVTAVARAAPAFWRTLPRTVRGRPTPAMQPASGYLSGCSDRVAVRGIARYMLDGEAFDADPSLPLVATAGPRLRLLAPSGRT